MKDEKSFPGQERTPNQTGYRKHTSEDTPGYSGSEKKGSGVKSGAGTFGRPRSGEGARGCTGCGCSPQSREHVNDCIECSVTGCEYHSECADYCSLDRIKVVKDDKSGSSATDCQSYSPKKTF